MTYENARRAGKTHPEMIEVIGLDDKRHIGNRGRYLNGELIQPGRADRRARGYRSNYGRSPFRKRVKAAPFQWPVLDEVVEIPR